MWRKISAFDYSDKTRTTPLRAYVCEVCWYSSAQPLWPHKDEVCWNLPSCPKPTTEPQSLTKMRFVGTYPHAWSPTVEPVPQRGEVCWYLPSYLKPHDWTTEPQRGEVCWYLPSCPKPHSWATEPQRGEVCWYLPSCLKPHSWATEPQRDEVCWYLPSCLKPHDWTTEPQRGEVCWYLPSCLKPHSWATVPQRDEVCCCLDEVPTKRSQHKKPPSLERRMAAVERKNTSWSRTSFGLFFNYKYAVIQYLAHFHSTIFSLVEAYGLKQQKQFASSSPQVYNFKNFMFQQKNLTHHRSTDLFIYLFGGGERDSLKQNNFWKSSPKMQKFCFLMYKITHLPGPCVSCLFRIYFLEVSWGGFTDT